MKAIVCTKYGPPEVLQLKEIEKPNPRDNEVLIKIHASSVTAVDIGYRRSLGHYGIGKTRKRMLGYYLAGEIEEVGKNVKRFKKGDQVYGGDVWSPGAYAEYKCIREKGVLEIKPSTITYDEAAALPYGGLTALPFLRDVGKVRKGQKVLIIGASGGIGIYAVQLAEYFGVDVTGVCSTTGLDLVKSLGAAHVIGYTRDDFTKNVKLMTLYSTRRPGVLFPVVKAHSRKTENILPRSLGRGRYCKCYGLQSLVERRLYLHRWA